MARKFKGGGLTAEERGIVKALLNRKWRNQDIHAQINSGGRATTMNSGRISASRSRHVARIHQYAPAAAEVFVRHCQILVVEGLTHRPNFRASNRATQNKHCRRKNAVYHSTVRNSFVEGSITSKFPSAMPKRAPCKESSPDLTRAATKGNVINRFRESIMAARSK
jgi:hypothetical protein